MDLTPAQKRKLTKQRQQEKKAQSKEAYHSKRALKLASSLSVASDRKASISETLTKIGYKNVEVKTLPITLKGKQNSVIQIAVRQKNMKRSTIQEQVKKIQKVLLKHKQNVKIEVAFEYNNGWYNGKFTDITEPLDFFNIIDYFDDVMANTLKKNPIKEQDLFNQYNIYIEYLPNAEGGADSELNDCFYKCIEQVLYDDIKKYWVSPAEFKKYCKLSRCDMVGFEHIPHIEKKTGYKYIVSGDAVYNSSYTSNKIIRLKLINNHYTLDIKRNNNIKSKIAFEEKQILLYNKKTFEAYDGDDKWILSKEERNEIFNNKRDTKYIIINKIDIDLSIEEEYKQVNNIANKLKIASNGEINMYKTGPFTTTALNLFDKYSKAITTDNIDQIEAEWIVKSSIGAIIFNNGAYSGPGYKYDVISMYPSILGSTMRFPIKAGEYKTLTTQELNNTQYLSYGIYRCIISCSNDKYINNLFRFNKNNYYTHFDIVRARELKLNIVMLEDDKINFLHYSRDKLITGNELFGKFIKKMYKLKNEKIEGAKSILTCLWGALTQQKLKKNFVNDDKELDLKNDELNAIKPSSINKNENIIKSNLLNNKFIFNYARLKPFLLSNARCLISNIIDPYKHDVVYAHTDGFILKHKANNIILGIDIGCLRYEGYNKNFWINNMQDYNKDSQGFIL